MKRVIGFFAGAAVGLAAFSAVSSLAQPSYGTKVGDVTLLPDGSYKVVKATGDVLPCPDTKDYFGLYTSEGRLGFFKAANGGKFRMISKVRNNISQDEARELRDKFCTDLLTAKPDALSTSSPANE